MTAGAAQVRLEVPALDLVLRPGEAVTTAAGTVDVLAGSARAGPVRLDGRRIDRRSLAGRVRAGLVLVGEAAVAPDVTIHDHVAAIVGRRRAARLVEAAPRIGGRADLPAGVLSGGERRILAWVRAVALDPRAVVLDRAGTGLDAAVLRWADGIVARWRDQGCAVVVHVGRPEEERWADPHGDD